MIFKHVSLALAFFFFASPNSVKADQFSFQLHQKGQSFSNSQLKSIQEFLYQAKLLMPPTMRERIGSPITIKFKRLDTKLNLEPPKCIEAMLDKKLSLSEAALNDSIEAESEKRIYGKASSKREIVLNSLLLNEILLGEARSTPYACGHRNMYRLALATILHETAHIYDLHSDHMPNGIVSKDRYYRKIAGWSQEWTVRHGFIRALRPRNHLPIRSPDPYEYRDIYEHFAVNMEYFLLDPEYRCRRPLLNNYFSEHFHHQLPVKCQLNSKISLYAVDSNLSGNEQVDLDPSRIYQIHYFPATPGSDIAGNWGHAMYRLIVCPPAPAAVGPDCMKNPENHVVVSYRAHVEEASLSIWKGLAGGYSSQMYLYPLSEVIDNYTKLELRDIRSLPLQLSQEEKDRFIYKILEQYWEYQGIYYFLTNNCNSESVHLLKSAVRRNTMKHFSALTPMTLQSNLASIGLLDESVINHEIEAIQKGFLFKSSRPALENAFAVVKEAYLDASDSKEWPWKDVFDYLKMSSAQDRALLFNIVPELYDNDSPQGKVFRMNLEEQKKTLASLYFLESFAQLYKNKSYREKIAFEIEHQSKGPQKFDDTQTEAYQDLLKLIKNAIPMTQLKSGYGVPLIQDFAPESSTLSANIAAGAHQAFEAWLQDNFTEDLKEIENIQKNKKYLRKMLQKLISSQ